MKKEIVKKEIGIGCLAAWIAKDLAKADLKEAEEGLTDGHEGGQEFADLVDEILIEATKSLKQRLALLPVAALELAKAEVQAAAKLPTIAERRAALKKIRIELTGLGTLHVSFVKERVRYTSFAKGEVKKPILVPSHIKFNIKKSKSFEVKLNEIINLTPWIEETL